MSYTILILLSAKQDLVEIKSYILRNFSLPVWQDTYNKIKKSINNLKIYPLTGSIFDEVKQLNLTQYRQVISGKNRIIYELKQKTVYIHAIVDARKDITFLLTTRLLRMN